MVKLGYALSSEEHTPNDLVRYAQRAEEVGFAFALVSDHYHPWLDQQGESPFVWSVIGAIAHTTQRLRLGTGVTCPTMRIHPAIIAQAGATAAAMMPGRFFLGVGTGENLNEHILGDHWPPHDLRLAMLAEAVDVIRLLWQGGTQT
jgi:coenzyme F420-dependent glucose-6-phosphate dehydrogenase